jgi:ankyrin repeat protein
MFRIMTLNRALSSCDKVSNISRRLSMKYSKEVGRMLREGTPDEVAAWLEREEIDVNASLVPPTAAILLTPLRVALMGRNAPVVKLLAERGALVDAVPGEEHAPLVSTLIDQDAATARVLLEAGANPNHVVEGVLPLVLALVNKDEVLVRLLVEFGADPDLVYDQYGTTPRRMANAQNWDIFA